METVNCTICGRDKESSKEAVFIRELILENGAIVPLGACSECIDYIEQNMEQGKAQDWTVSEDSFYQGQSKTFKSHDGDMLLCTCCGRNQKEAKFIISCCRFYRLDADKNSEIHPVSQDQLFLEANKVHGPIKLGEATFCDCCLRRAATQLRAT